MYINLLRVAKITRFGRSALTFFRFTPLLLAANLAYALPSGFVKNSVITNLQSPVNLVSLPDGRLLIAEKAGVLKLYDPNSAGSSVTTILRLVGIESRRERGLASIAISPNFTNDGYVYLYYTQNRNGNRNRISRFNFVNGSISQNTEVLVWEDNAPYMSCCHFGGGLDFGPDGMLYLTTGEEFDGPQSPDLTRAGGKIIRLNVQNITPSTPWVRGAQNTHIIPADNPANIMDGPGGNLDEIWAYGLRNPFRAHWDIQGNRFFIGDVGGNVQSSAYEELNLGVANVDYGWPLCEGPCAQAGVENPVYSYDHQQATPAGGAIVAGVVYRGLQFPLEYQNRFFFSDYALSTVSYLHLNSNNVLTAVTPFDTDVGAPVAIEEGIDGSLYVVDYLNGHLIEYGYAPDNQPPQINYALASDLSGSAPLTVSFSASATDSDGDALTYSWTLGDGTPARNGQNITTTYTNDGVYFARLRVGDGTTDVLSEVIEIQVGSQPVASILYPSDGATFEAGDTISFDGAVSNQANNTNYSFNWTIDFLHNAHRHPGLNHDQAQGQFDISTTGHDYLGQTGYELALTVTGPGGLNDTTSVTIQPDKIDLSLNTIPSGIPILVDGVQLSTPVTYDNIIGFEHVVSTAEDMCLDGVEYQFQNWSDGGQRIHSIVLPANNTSLTAQFSPVGDCDDSGVEPILVTTGLVAYYVSEDGVVLNNNGELSQWLDQSGSANDLNLVQGDPQLVASAINGYPAVDFDGTGDLLRRNDNLTGLASTGADRTMYVVARYRGAGYGGVAYGNANFNQTFGLGVHPRGDLMVQGWGASNDFITNTVGSGAGWMVQSAILQDSNLVHYQGSTPIDTEDHDFNTALDGLVIGAEIDGVPQTNMQLASILIYDRALTPEEHTQNSAFLEEKYFGDNPGNPVNPEPTNIAPVAVDDSVVVAQSSITVIDVVTNDTDTENELSPQSVVAMEPPTYGSLQNNFDGTFAYTHDGSPVDADSFSYTVSDDAGLTSNIATVSIEVQLGDPADPGDPGIEPILVTSGLVAYYVSEDGVVLNNNGELSQWLDQSGSANDLNLVQGDPQLVASAINGYPAVDFDGTGDLLRRDDNLNGLASSGSDRAMYVVARYRGAGYGGVAYGDANFNQTFGLGVHPRGDLMVQGWGTNNDFIANTRGVGAGWIVQSAILRTNSLEHYQGDTVIDNDEHDFNTMLSGLMVGAEIDGAPQTNMQLASILIYNRALTLEEHEQNIAFLEEKYFGDNPGNPEDPEPTNTAPVAVDDMIVVDAGGETVANILDNDYDSDGLINVATINIEREAEFGDVLELSDGTVRYQNTNSAQTADSFSYAVADDQGAVSNAAEVSVSIETDDTVPNEPSTNAFPAEGLVLHLEADVGVEQQNQSVSNWNDQSPYGNNLVAGDSQPRLVQAADGRRYISFDGIDDILENEQTIFGLPAGDADRTMYTVVSYETNGNGGVSYGFPSINQVYGHAIHRRGSLMLQGWGASNDILLPANARNLGWSVHGSAVNGSEVTHYLDGVVIQTDTQLYDTSPQRIVIGAEIDGTPFIGAEISAVFVYDRDLSDQEHAEINQYLIEKYVP